MLMDEKSCSKGIFLSGKRRQSGIRHSPSCYLSIAPAYTIASDLKNARLSARQKRCRSNNNKEYGRNISRIPSMGLFWVVQQCSIILSVPISSIQYCLCVRVRIHRSKLWMCHNLHNKKGNPRYAAPIWVIFYILSWDWWWCDACVLHSSKDIRRIKHILCSMHYTVCIT